MNDLFKKKFKYCGENVIISNNIRIRKPEDVIIHNNVIIDDYSYFSCGMEIGEYCHLSSHLNISGGEGFFTIGRYSTIASHCSIHTCSSDYVNMSMDLPSVPSEKRFGGQVSKIIVNDFVTIGSHSVILPNVVLPKGFSCGAFSLLNDKVKYEEYSLYIGIPAKFYSKRTLDGFSEENYK